MGRFQVVTTNDKKNSTKEIKIKIVEFDTLWRNYPSSNQLHSTKDSDDIYGNYCAVNVSESFLASNIEMKSFSKKSKCWGNCNRPNQHAFRAQDLANWLKKSPILGLKKVQKFTGKTYEKGVKGKTGIIFFQDYWQRSNEKGKTRTGDHIDLWNDGTLASIGSFQSIIRIGIGINIDGVWSDFSKSKEVLFWEIK